MRQIHRLLLGAIIAVALGFVVVPVTSAHEHRELGDGRYSVVVGFSTEPAYTGFMNGLDFRVSDMSMATPAADEGEATGAPVEGLEATLQVEIIYGDQRMPLTLEPRWRTPGAYDAWVVPMAAGDYSFHIFGTIGELAVDETFTSSPETFSAVADQTTIQFPKPAEAASASAPMFGTVTTEASGIDGGMGAAAAFGAVIGVAALLLVQRKRQRVVPATVGAGVGD